MVSFDFGSVDFNCSKNVIEFKKKIKDSFIAKELKEKEILNFIKENSNSLEAGLLTSVLCELVDNTKKTKGIMKFFDKKNRFYNIAKEQEYGFLGFEGELLKGLRGKQAYHAKVTNVYDFDDDAGKNLKVIDGHIEDFKGCAGRECFIENSIGKDFFEKSLYDASIIGNSIITNLHNEAGEVLVLKDHAHLSNLYNKAGKVLVLRNHAHLSNLYDNSCERIDAFDDSTINNANNYSISELLLYDNSQFNFGHNNSCRKVSLLGNSHFQNARDYCGSEIIGDQNCKISKLYGSSGSKILANGKTQIFDLSGNSGFFIELSDFSSIDDVGRDAGIRIIKGKDTEIGNNISESSKRYIFDKD